MAKTSQADAIAAWLTHDRASVSATGLGGMPGTSIGGLTGPTVLERA